MTIEGWAQLQAEAQGCRACPGVSPGSAALSALNGPVPCDLLFVGEASGRRGAGRTGIPFSGDHSGKRFEALLAAAGLTRAEVFITNAVLCLPLDAKGRNRTVLASEVAGCHAFLVRTIEVVRPRMIVTLGAVALRALGGDGVGRLSEAVARPMRLGGRLVFPLYHPGRQAELHRSWADQVEDWRGLGRLVRAGRLADRAFGAEAGDPFRVVPEAGQDVVGVLADKRRG